MNKERLNNPGKSSGWTMGDFSVIESGTFLRWFHKYEIIYRPRLTGK